MRIWTVAVVFAMLGTVLLSSTVNAASGALDIRADLEGRPIKAADISSYYCHDYAFPEIHCYSSAAELEAASTSAQSFIAASFGPSDYVTIYSEPTYGGAYMHLSQNYDTLFWIGWNDRVSSYKPRNGARGTFWSDWYGTGRGTDFCCDQTVPYLPSSVDNTFTSVYRG
jgi:hypothetical protein